MVAPSPTTRPHLTPDPKPWPSFGHIHAHADLSPLPRRTCQQGRLFLAKARGLFVDKREAHTHRASAEVCAHCLVLGGLAYLTPLLRELQWYEQA